jgi:zinc and cadmium transporter
MGGCRRMLAVLSLYCAGIVAASLLGGALPLATVLTHTRLQLYLSFAAGTMLGAAFFHMLPEAVEMGHAGTLRWAAAGLLALFFLERFFAFHQHESPEVVGESHDHAAPMGHHKATALHWGAAALGLAVHTLIGGFALASAVAAGPDSAVGPTARGVFLATLIHKPADALTLVSLMLRAGAPRLAAHAANLAFSMLIPAGVLLFFLGRRWAGASSAGPFTATALAFSAGTFLLIALGDLLPELQFHEHDRVKLSVALLAGVGLMATAGLGG